MQTHWRLAFMFDAPDHDLAALSGAMTRSGTGIRALAAGHHVRIGVAYRHSNLGTSALRQADKGWADVDGAIEFSIANERVAEIPDLCRALRPVIAAFCSLDTVDVMAGPMFHMVPVRQGGALLS